ncbi:MAG: lipopolysaccharide kinase InaA family protein [Longimicrobiales bacterium]|nr:lipopolysaccharide kinase InaA family protein [Longimicrobiales bacterium]
MPISVSLPDGYRPVTRGGTWAFGAERVLPWLEEVLAAGQTLHAWAASHPERRELSGRGRVFSVPAPLGARPATRWVFRHYHRGGAVARWLGDRYLALGRHRPLQEARASVEVGRRGIPTPTVVAGAVYREGLFYRADLVTEEIPGAADLAAVLFAGVAPGLDAEAALMAAGALVRRLEAAGVFHPDLNAKNIVLQPDPTGVRAHLVDLDRCTLRPEGARTPVHAMRRRLERSLRKCSGHAGRPLPESAWSALRSGFGVGRAGA